MKDIELLHALNHANGVYRRLHHQIVEADGTLDSKEMFGYGRLLHTLIRQNDMTQKELAEKLEIRPQSLTTALEKLEDKGYVTRLRDQNDRRIQVVHLTDEGREIGSLLHNLRSKTAKQYFSCLNNDEKEELLLLLNKVLENNHASHR